MKVSTMATWHYTIDLADAYMKYGEGGSENNKAYVKEVIKKIGEFLESAEVKTSTADFNELKAAMREMKDGFEVLLKMDDLNDFDLNKELDIFYDAGDIFKMFIKNF